MKSIRIKNDIPFEWTFTREGEETPISQVSTDVYLTHKYGKFKVEYTIEDNTIHGVFRLKDQTKLGVYKLVLSTPSNTIDIDFVNLVPSSSMETGTDSNSLTTSPIQLSSDITLPANGIGIKSIVTNTSSLDGGNNTITITLDSGEETTFVVKNGSKGTDANVAGCNTAIAQVNAILDQINNAGEEHSFVLRVEVAPTYISNLIPLKSGETIKISGNTFSSLYIEGDDEYPVEPQGLVTSYSYTAYKDMNIYIRCEKNEGVETEIKYTIGSTYLIDIIKKSIANCNNATSQLAGVISNANNAIERVNRINVSIQGSAFTVTDADGVTNTVDISGPQGIQGEQGVNYSLFPENIILSVDQDGKTIGQKVRLSVIKNNTVLSTGYGGCFISINNRNYTARALGNGIYEITVPSGVQTQGNEYAYFYIGGIVFYPNVLLLTSLLSNS